MKKERRSKYPLEYKRRIVDLVRTGRTASSLAAEYGVHYTTILTWVKAADVAATKSLHRVARSDPTELQRLRDRVRSRRRFATAAQLTDTDER
jgi:transposase-like protein